jgi:hypothetical protein
LSKHSRCKEKLHIESIPVVGDSAVGAIAWEVTGFGLVVVARVVIGTALDNSHRRSICPRWRPCTTMALLCTLWFDNNDELKMKDRKEYEYGIGVDTLEVVHSFDLNISFPVVKTPVKIREKNIQDFN